MATPETMIAGSVARRIRRSEVVLKGRIPRATFRRLLLKEPTVGLRVLEAMARRARPREPIDHQ
ncbi:MAG TPA: hypothetical protein VFT27_01255 [Actinomycetota bacterium]|nr:hypothetical protein [Actinomycetota bacterium]